MAYFVLNNGQNFYLTRIDGVFYIKTVVVINRLVTESGNALLTESGNNIIFLT